MAVFWVVALMMEAARTSETLENFYQTTQRYNPEDSHLCTHRREHLKSCFIIITIFIVVTFLIILAFIISSAATLSSLPSSQ
jgi:uncharacterized membrane protein